MAEHYLGVEGNLHSQEKNLIESCFSALLSSVWEGKPIWEHIGNGDLTAAPCMKGELYGKSEGPRLMVVGRSVNRWEVDFGECSTLEDTVTNVLKQENSLYKFATKSTVQEDGSTYYHARSPFLRFMRTLAKEFYGTDENWPQRLLWSNLYKIAPRHKGNPPMSMVRNDIPIYRDILRLEIQQHRPDLVLFVTDISWFHCYPDSKKYESFTSLMAPLPLEWTDMDCRFVQAVGHSTHTPDVKMMVCCRPEGRKVEEMVKEIRAIDSRW